MFCAIFNFQTRSKAEEGADGYNKPCQLRKQFRQKGKCDMAILEVEHLKKTYTTRLGSNRVEALKDVNFTVERGEFVAIMGESGSGKTTLLNLLAALDKPTGGQVRLNGKNLGELKEKEIA